MRSRTAVDNTRCYRRIHLEVTLSPSPATATTFLPDGGGGRGGLGESVYGADAQDMVMQGKIHEAYEAHCTVCLTSR